MNSGSDAAQAMDSIAVAVIAFAVVLIVVTVAFIVPQILARHLNEKKQLALEYNHRKSGIPKGEPVIGYKRAFLDFGDALPFRGVGGFTPYGVDEEMVPYTQGFHIFFTLDEAYDHSQAGSVFLEVVGSGSVDLYQKGTIASHQRVLQIIVGNCDRCANQATRLTWLRHPRLGNQVYGLCDSHRGQSQTFSFSDLRRELAQRTGYVLPVVPRYPTKKHHGYVATRTQPQASLSL